MRKEVILAVIIGVLLGGVILYGINLANTSSSIKQDSQDTADTNSKVTPTPIKKTAGDVSIILPLKNSVVTESTIALKGSTKPNSNIAIVSESDDLITSSDNSGNFQADINLINGENTVIVTAVDDKQKTSSTTITIIRTATLPE